MRPSTETRLEVNAISTQTTQLRGTLQTEISRIRPLYNHLISSVDDFDSATNAELRDALKANLKKKEAAVALLDKLLSFINNSTSQIALVDNCNRTNYDAMR